jgi:hypothetical protein
MKGEESITLPTGDRLALFDRARKEALKEGITITGDTKTGDFSGGTILGTIAGTYRTDDRQIHITITRKPLLVPKTILRRVLEGFFLEAVTK